MNDVDVCDAIRNETGELFTCSEHGDYHRIRTPYLYPDGDNIDVFCKLKDDAITVTDLAETTGWLRMQSTSLRRSPKQNQLIADICLTHGVEFSRGMLQTRGRSGEKLAETVIRVAQAALRVSDLWFTFRTRAVESIVDEVADYLAERKMEVERSKRLAGRSTRSWTVDFQVRARNRSSLVYVLSTGSRSAAQGIAEHVLAAWYDLNHLAAEPDSLNFVSLFDDTANVWTDRDFRLLEPLSIVSRWSRPDEFAAVLSDAA